MRVSALASVEFGVSLGARLISFQRERMPLPLSCMYDRVSRVLYSILKQERKKLVKLGRLISGFRA